MNRRSRKGEPEKCDLAIIGAGAAGLAAAIFAGEMARGTGTRIVLIESAKKPGAKILVSGGGRCNVTNSVVTENDFWGGSPHTIRKVLNAFSNQDAIGWFRRMGVSLKREASAKLFPSTNQARTVLAALLNRASELGIALRTGSRVMDLRPNTYGFAIAIQLTDGGQRTVHARRVICAAGGLALPKSGSDGTGLSIMQRMGHVIIPTTPALAPLILKAGPSIGGRYAEFRGVTVEARLRLCQGESSKPLIELDGSLLFTHFGVSGPVAMNLSRHWQRAKLDDPGAPLRVLLGIPVLRIIAQADEWLQDRFRAHPKSLVRSVLEELYPSCITVAMAAEIGDDISSSEVTRDSRCWLAGQLVEMPLDVTGTRGYTFAEATAGGVDLHDVDWHTLESRRVKGLHLCGEILDVDGRIGGFNFQWAWSSGCLAGRGAASGLAQQ
jgi:predicted Rossmann fold flavoprotein